MIYLTIKFIILYNYNRQVWFLPFPLGPLQIKLTIAHSSLHKETIFIRDPSDFVKWLIRFIENIRLKTIGHRWDSKETVCESNIIHVDSTKLVNKWIISTGMRITTQCSSVGCFKEILERLEVWFQRALWLMMVSWRSALEERTTCTWR